MQFEKTSYAVWDCADLRRTRYCEMFDCRNSQSGGGAGVRRAGSVEESGTRYTRPGQT